MKTDKRKPLDITILPNEIYYKICLFRYHCPQFDLGIEVNIIPAVMQQKTEITIPAPHQIEYALNDFFQNSAIDLLEGLGCVFFHYHGCADPDTGYIDFSSDWLSSQSLFRKAYSNFYNNFNSKNYIYG